MHRAECPIDVTGLAGAISSVAVSRDRGSRQELNVQLVVAAFAITVCPQQLAHLRRAAAHRTKLVPHDLDQQHGVEAVQRLLRALEHQVFGASTWHQTGAIGETEVSRTWEASPPIWCGQCVIHWRWIAKYAW